MADPHDYECGPDSPCPDRAHDHWPGPMPNVAGRWEAHPDGRLRWIGTDVEWSVDPHDLVSAGLPEADAGRAHAALVRSVLARPAAEDDGRPCDDCGEADDVQVIRVCLSCRPDLCPLCIGLGEVHYSSIELGRCPQCGGSGRTDVRVMYEDDPDDQAPEHRVAAMQAVVDAAVAETEYEQMNGAPSEELQRARLLAVARLWNADHPASPGTDREGTATEVVNDDGS